MSQGLSEKQDAVNSGVYSWPGTTRLDDKAKGRQNTHWNETHHQRYTPSKEIIKRPFFSKPSELHVNAYSPNATNSTKQTNNPTHQGPTLYFNLIPMAASSTSRYFNTPGTATIVVSSPPTHLCPSPSSQISP